MAARARRRFRTRGAVVAVVAVAVVTVAASCGTSSSRASAEHGRDRRRPGLASLHHVGAWLVDGQGRVVVTHGFDIIWKPAPYYPPSFSARDARFLVSEGFTGARIGPLWSGVEPQPGRYDPSYVARIAHVNDVLARYGIRSLVEFHQDFFSATAGTGDGAPSWATLGTPSPQAFQAFWDDTPVAGTGLVEHFAGAWRLVATALHDAPNLLGFDVLNEPYAGSATGCALFAPCPVFEQTTLAAFYRKLVGTIRTADPRAIVFYEPVPQLTGSATALPAPLDDDTDLGFTFHSYDRACDLIADPTTPEARAAQNQRCTPDERAALDAGIAYAKRANAAVDLGEFGGSANYTDDANMADLAGARFLNWTYWMYYGADAEPEGGQGGGGGVLLHANQPGSEANAEQPLLDALVVPYPEQIAGTPLAYSLDRSTWTMHLAYSTTPVDPRTSCRGAVTEVLVPRRQYPRGYQVHVTGARVVSSPHSPWVELVANRGASQVSMTLTRADDSHTDVPTTAVDPHAPRPRCSTG